MFRSANFLLVLLLLFLLTTPIMALDTAKVKLVTQTQAWGQVVIGLILEYNCEIDPSQVSPSLFYVLANRVNEYGGEISPRTITKVYTNNAPSLTAKPVTR